jgi:glycosyltransferase involved in cell wall biosynthesis
MLEAMASGMPVFATNHGGIPEAIEDGVSGVLVNEREHDVLGQALIDWTACPHELDRLAQAGASAVETKFEQGAQVRVLEAIYAEALDL